MAMLNNITQPMVPPTIKKPSGRTLTDIRKKLRKKGPMNERTQPVVKPGIPRAVMLKKKLARVSSMRSY